MTTTKTPHGRYEHGTPERGEGGCWHRMDLYFSDNQEYAAMTDPAGKGTLDRMACAGRQDDSAYHDSSRHYDAKCPCCWLGHGHTVNLHNRYVEGSK